MELSFAAESLNPVNLKKTPDRLPALLSSSRFSCLSSSSASSSCSLSSLCTSYTYPPAPNDDILFILALSKPFLASPVSPQMFFNIPYPPSQAGYWSPVTSTLNWCEEVALTHYTIASIRYQWTNGFFIGLLCYSIRRRNCECLHQYPISIPGS